MVEGEDRVIFDIDDDEDDLEALRICNYCKEVQ